MSNAAIMSNNYQVLINYRSTKGSTFSAIVADSLVEAQNRAREIMESSIDIESVIVFQAVARAQKVEIVQWN